MNELRRGIMSAEITALYDSERRISTLIAAEEKALEAQPDSIENSQHSATARVVIAVLKFARDNVQKAIKNLKMALEPSIEHIDIGSAECSQ
jgi:hypothetical protein